MPMKKLSPLSRFTLAHFFEYQWAFLLVGAVAAALLFYYPINAINAYPSTERLDAFFLVAEEKEPFLQSLADPEGDIKEVRSYFYSPSTSNIGDVYTAYGVFADLLLLRDREFEDVGEYVEEMALALPDEISSQISLPMYQTSDGKSYGVKIYDGEDEAFNEAHRFLDWLDFASYEGSYYLVIGPESDNIAPYNGKSVNGGAFEALFAILEAYS